ncbi:MAG TPA: trimeric intracellular cation channel family protein [Thermoanaerobaculia bacterium]|nr:trimeric intracellular cation channel family protein [Thermoanaerobaculia bacterium]
MISQAFLKALDFAGVFVFAVSGALAGGRRRLDLFGVFVVAVVTGIGGGTLRDLLLGRLPVFWVREPEYLGVAAAATAATVLFTRFRMPKESRLLMADALGLALFSVTGAQIAETVTDAKIVVVLMGAATAAGGGMIRDVLLGDVPLILRGRELYATAAGAGAAVYVGLGAAGAARPLAAGAGLLTTLVLRVVSLRHGVGLPAYELPENGGGSR